MVIGNINKIAFVVEKISDWSVCGLSNGNIQLFINGKGYPQQQDVVTLNMEINNIIDDLSPLINPVNDRYLFEMSALQLFDYFCCCTFDESNFAFKLPFTALTDEGWFVFIVTIDERVRFQIGKYINGDKFIFEDETIINRKELNCIIQQLKEYMEYL